MDMKTFRQRVRTLWETKGYIFVIGLCVAVLGGTALLTGTTFSGGAQTPMPPIETPYLSDAFPPYEAPARVSETPSATGTPAPENAAEAGASLDARQAVSLIAPAEGSYGLRFSGDNLVYLGTLDAWGVHNGLDIQADEGQAVRAVMEGAVESITDDPINGLCVILSHPNGMTSRYMGLSATEGLSKDKDVTAGQIIGKVGVMPSERDEGPHLHFELHGAAGYIDPEPLLSPLNK